jgi:hypothetical protein
MIANPFKDVHAHNVRRTFHGVEAQTAPCEQPEMVAQTGLSRFGGRDVDSRRRTR